VRAASDSYHVVQLTLPEPFLLYSQRYAQQYHLDQ
jgi:hypothetical protein